MRIDEKILLGVEVDLKVDSDWKKLINIIKVHRKIKQGADY